MTDQTNDRLTDTPSMVRWVDSILDEVTYRPPSEFHVGTDGARVYLQLRMHVVDADKPGDIWHSGRKWLLSPYMTRSEVVLTAFKAALTFEEHECREWFRYRGARVCGPHLDVDDLADGMKAGTIKESVRT